MLFRRQVVEAQHNRLAGKVMLLQPVSLYVSGLFVFLMFVFLLVYLSQFQYARKETVKGYLLPKSDVVKIYAGRAGVLEELYVQEGSEVEQGQALAVIRNSQSLTAGEELSFALTREVNIQLGVLKRELLIAQRAYSNDKLRLEQQIAKLTHSRDMVEKARATSLKRLAIKQELFGKNQRLQKNGHISNTRLATVEEEYLAALQASEHLEKDQAAIEVEITQLEAEKRSLPESLALKQVSTQKAISQLNAQLVELEHQYQFVRKAPKSGKITTIQASRGYQLKADTLLLNIIPAQSPLEMELLLPTRSAGFVQIGDKVRIRFDAFPYQKFGLSLGEVVSVDQALILPGDKALPIPVEQAMYRVRAKLDRQMISAYGQQFRLKIGMLGEADIILEKRSLLQWLLDPIYAIKGKLG